MRICYVFQNAQQIIDQQKLKRNSNCLRFLGTADHIFAQTRGVNSALFAVPYLTNKKGAAYKVGVRKRLPQSFNRIECSKMRLVLISSALLFGLCSAAPLVKLEEKYGKFLEIGILLFF
jgi:hypothetical protein